MSEKKVHIQRILIFLFGVIFNIVIMLFLPQLLSAWFSVDAAETVIILGVLLAMGLIAWFTLSFFLLIINREKDSLEDKDIQQLYDELKIRKHERCTKYVDVCSISRALDKEGLNIEISQDDKTNYRIHSKEEIISSIKDSKEIIILSEQFSALSSVKNEFTKVVIEQINRGLIVHEIYDGDVEHEEEFNQFKSDLYNLVDKKYADNVQFKLFESTSSYLGNVFTTFVKAILISRNKDNEDFYSEGYLVFYSSTSEEEIYYKMPYCLLHSFEKYLDR